jgi:hypothetical protein
LLILGFQFGPSILGSALPFLSWWMEYELVHFALALKVY